MIGIFLALFMVLMGSSGAAAQGCGPTNPNCVVPTAPVGTSDNRAASTKFVQNPNGSVNVLSFGCKGNGIADDAPCINAAFAYARTLKSIDSSLCINPTTNCWYTARIILPPLQYKVCSPLNWTGLQSTLTNPGPVTIEGYGSIIYAGTDCFSAGNPVISMIDDVGVKLLGLTIVSTRCDGLFLPTNGIQIGASATSVNAHNNTWHDVNVRGCFQYAPAYILGAETFLCVNCNFQQGYNSASYSVILDDRNSFSITDPFGHTPSYAPGTHHSNIGQTFVGGQFISTNTGAGQAMFISGNEKLVLQNTYVNTTATVAVTVNTDIINSNRLWNWNWQLNIEGANLLNVFQFTGSQNPVINGLQFSANNVSAQTSIFTIGSGGVFSVTFNGADIRIGSLPFAGVTMFDNAALYTMSGLVMFPSGNHWNEPAVWNGCVFIAAVSTCATGSNRYSALTFGTLPTATAGTVAYITDGLAGNCADGTCTTFGTNVTGGTGALRLLLWRNATNWTLIGK